MRLELNTDVGISGAARLVVRDSPVPACALLDRPPPRPNPVSVDLPIEPWIICRRFELIEPDFPIDDPWTLRPIAGPLPPKRSVASAASTIATISEVDELAYLAFAEGSRAENAGQALAALPDGAYWLVRRSLPSVRSDWLQLGNDHIPIPPFADVVFDDRNGRPDRRGLYAAAFGVSAPPTYERPLVGIPILAWSGNDVQDALLFFDVGEEPSRSSAPGQMRTGDAMFVIPADKIFVLRCPTSESGARLGPFVSVEPPRKLNWRGG